MSRKIVLIIALLMGVGISYAQDDTEEVVKTPSDSVQIAVMQDNMKKVPWNTDPLSPAKAAFYSAVIPGLGQISEPPYTSMYKTLRNTIVTSLPTNVVNKDLPMMNFMALPPVDNRVSVPMD